jgi:N4-(beta-N-acetylglucosaminyl)-L-asparaginase
MHGPSHKAGAVAALQNIRNASSVALQVLRRTDHALLVGAGALKFAKAMGFQEQDLLTEKSRNAWLRWKANLNKNDDWLDRDQQIPAASQPQRQSRAPAPAPECGEPMDDGMGVPFTHGTIHCSALNAAGDLSACTSTSGLSWKLAGRIGDSPIPGAGMFCDNEVGSAGATGRGEAVIQACGAFQVVRHMADGMDPVDACLKALHWIAEHTKQAYLLDENGRPNFGVTMYALRKDGAYGSATMRREKGRPNSEKFAIHDGTNARLEECVVLFDE